MTKFDQLPFLRTLVFLLVTLALGVLHFQALQEWYGRAVSEERYSHTPFVLAVAIYILWQRRHAVGYSAKGRWVGLVVAAIAGAGLIIGELSALWTIVQYSFVLMLIGVAWALTGDEFRKIFFPFLLILAAVPLPYMLDVVLSGKMQLLSSQFGAMILRWLGIAVYLEGNIIDLGVYKLQVVEACSGLNYMFPLMTIGLMFAYLYKAPKLVKLVIFLSTIPISILMNSARIALVGVVVNRNGSGAAEGFLHFFEGWVVFMLCLFLLMVEAWVFNRVLARNGSLLASFGDIAVPNADKMHSHTRAKVFAKIQLAPAVLAIFFALGASLVGLALDRRDEVVPARKIFAFFPMEMDGWSGKSFPFRNREDEILGLEDYLLADFERGSQVVNLYAGYVSSQRKGFVPHSPKACIPGGGWEIADARYHIFDIAGKHLKVTRLLIGLGNQQQVVYYWFRQRGRDLPDEYSMKFYLLHDSITMNRTDGSIVRLVVPVKSSAEKADEVAKQFLEAAYTRIPVFIPD